MRAYPMLHAVSSCRLKAGLALCAVPAAGLVGVVINGLPNQMGGSQLLHAPRSVLWGQHTFGTGSLGSRARV